MRAGRVVWLGGGKPQSLCDGGDHWENERTTLLPDALPKRKLVRVAVGWRRGSPPGGWRGRRLDRQGEVASGQAVFGRGVGVPGAFRYAGCGIRLGRMPNKRFLVSCVISDCVVVSWECKALWLIARGKPVQDRWSARAPECSCSTKRPATTRGSIGGIPDESSCGVEGREAVTRGGHSGPRYR